MNYIIKLPTDILFKIAKMLSLNDSYQLALTSKSFYESLKRSEVDIVYTVNTENVTAKTDYLNQQITRVSAAASINIHNLRHIRQLLKKLHLYNNLIYIDFTKLKLNTRGIKLLAESLNNHKNKENLNIQIPQLYKSQFESVMDRSSISSKRKEVEEEEEFDTKKQRTDEDIPVELLEEAASFSEYINRSKVKDLPANIAPHMQRLQLDTQNYKLALKLQFPEYNSNDRSTIEEAINSISKQLANAVFISGDGCWLVVSQMEFYYNDKAVDDCSFGFHKKKSAGAMKLVVEKKGDLNRWVEAKIFVGDFEVLLTGGVVGFLGDEPYLVDPFLGASCSKLLECRNYWLAYTPADTNSNETNNSVRLLRNFSKRSSMFKWSITSKHFAGLNFSCASPFQATEVSDIAKLVAMLIRLGGEVDDTAMINCKEELKQSKIYKDLSCDDEEEAVEKIKNSKIGVMKKLFMKCLLENNKDLFKKNSVEFYKTIIYPELSKVNEKKIKAFKESLTNTL